MNLKRCGGMGPAIVMIALLVAAGGCSGKKTETAAPAGGTETAAAATETAKPEAVAGGAEVSKSSTGFVIKGSGNATVGPVDLDKGCYIVKSKYSSGEYSMMTFSWIDKYEGNDIDRNIAFVPSTLGGDYIRVFSVDLSGQPSKPYTFKIEATGAYEIEFQTPPAADTALAAPQTFTGGAGYAVTPLVKNTGTYIMLQIKYTGTVEGNAGGGIPLVSGDLYDAETGDPVVRNQFCYKPGVVSDDGHSGQKPGVYFAVINCSQKDGAWEATIKQ
jgi:hypothetical protein